MNGIDLDGSWIEHDIDSTKALYGKNDTSADLLTGRFRSRARPRLSLRKSPA